MNNKLNIILFVLISTFILLNCSIVNGEYSQQLLYPGESWLQYASPEEAGFSSERLEKAKEYFEKMDSSAVMVIYDGAVLVSWGDVDRRYMCHSIRKSYLSALYGIYVDKGKIDLNKTLGELRITDDDRLTEIEKKARIIDLLKARSGVYIPAAYETPGMANDRPERGSHEPGTYWYYNNWDFNVLGTIFEQETGKKIFEEFKERIADPLQMQDYRVMDGYYQYEKKKSVYPAYPFKMSARDMARFGLLYLRKGKWQDQQIISENWIDESTKAYSNIFPFNGYGYLWWGKYL
jgi:CubicO group peptidase (beta-lactamase class C family)